jgi:hypothetical protein
LRRANVGWFASDLTKPQKDVPEHGYKCRDPWVERTTNYLKACPVLRRGPIAASCCVKSARSPSSAGELSFSFVSSCIVGIGKLPGRVGGTHGLNLLVEPGSIFWETTDDNCDGDTASSISDGVRRDNPT